MAPLSLVLVYQAASDYDTQEEINKLHCLSVNIVKDSLEQMNSDGVENLEDRLEILKSIWVDSKIRWSVFYVDGDEDLKRYLERLLVAIRNAE